MSPTVICLYFEYLYFQKISNLVQCVIAFQPFSNQRRRRKIWKFNIIFVSIYENMLKISRSWYKRDKMVPATFGRNNAIMLTHILKQNYLFALCSVWHIGLEHGQWFIYSNKWPISYQLWLSTQSYNEVINSNDDD